MQVFILTGCGFVDDEGTWSNLSVHATRAAAETALKEHMANAIADYEEDGPTEDDYVVEEHEIKM